MAKKTTPKKAATKADTPAAPTPIKKEPIKITNGLAIPVVRRNVESRMQNAIKACPIGGTFPIGNRNALSHALRKLKERGEVDADVKFATRPDPLGEGKFRAWRTD